MRSHDVIRGRSQRVPGQRGSGSLLCLSWISPSSREVSHFDPPTPSWWQNCCAPPLLLSRSSISPATLVFRQPSLFSSSRAFAYSCALCSAPHPHRTNPSDRGISSSVIFSRGPFPTTSPKSAPCSHLYHFIVSRTFSRPDIILFIYLFAALATVSPSIQSSSTS